MSEKRAKALRENADRIFNKSYTLKSSNEEYSLPQVDTMFTTAPFEIEALSKMRDELNATKSLLNDKDIEQWRRHTKATNPCGVVVQKVREQINPELCTQAWLKFYEILNRCDVIPQSCLTSKYLNSFHLCEAPGAFITSFNHYIKSTFIGDEVLEWKWLASSLNPFYEGNDTRRMIEGEKFILETQAHWMFGRCFDGDLMNWSNLEGLQQSFENMKKADIVTADGSIDCADEPERQEMIIGQLLYCEVVAALILLAPGGSFVVKIFTMFEHNTVCLLFLLSCCFIKVEIVKPGTSKAGNSELYCVCTTFIGTDHLPEDLFEKLHLAYSSEAPTMSLYSKDVLPSNFLKSVENCAKMFSKYQQDAILKNLDLFENFTKGKRRFLSSLRQYVAVDYVQRFNVNVLDQSSFVVPHAHLTGSQLSYWPEVAKDFDQHSGYHSGCYQQRVEQANLSWQDRVVFPRTSLPSVQCEDSMKEQLHVYKDYPVQWLAGSSVADVKPDIMNWDVCFGKPIERIKSSRFCPSSLIEKLDEARTNATVLNTEEGRAWMDQTERLSVVQLGPISPPHNIIDNVLRKCNVIDNELKSHFVDISGDCRFINEILTCGCCPSDQCSGLLCVDCASTHSESSSTNVVLSASNCLHLDKDGQLSDLCHKENGSFSSIIIGSVFAACKSHSTSQLSTELLSQEKLLNQCVVAFKVLGNGDSFVCEVSDTLTQFTAGIIYILHMLFKEIAIFPVTGKLGCSPKQFLVCHSFISSTDNVGVIQYMENVVKSVRGESLEQDVVCFLPTANLFCKPFYMYLREHTSNHVHRQLNSIINLERIWLTTQAV